MEDENNTNVSNDKVIRNWKKYITPVLLLISIVGIVYLVNISDKWFVAEKITEYEINGLRLNDSEKFFEKARNISFGKPKDSVLLKSIETEIEKYAYIEKCVASFASQSKIKLDLEERIPFAFYNIGGKLDYLDLEGHILPYKVLKEYSDFVIVSGIKQTDTLLIKTAINIIGELQKKQEVFDFVSELRYMNKENGFEIIGPFNYTKIYLGLDDNIANKIEKLKVLMSNKSAHILLSNVKKIDLRWLDRIIIERI